MCIRDRTYDAYVINETMMGYGIDNSEQEQWLVENGFRIHPTTYSVAASTLFTMGRVFGVRPPLQHSASGDGADGGKHQLRRSVSGDGPLFRQLKQAGYTTYGIFWSGYFFRGVGSHYDVSFPPEGSSALTLSSAIYEGVFRHDASFRKPTYDLFVAEKRLRLSEKSSTPKFVYTHTGPSHSQNSGQCLADETALFEDRLAIANVEMKADVLAIRDSDPDAIIIVNGDHGPYLTLNCRGITETPQHEINRLHLQDRYGTFLAIFGPPEFVENFEPTVIQDLAPAVLNHIYPENSFEEYVFAPEVPLYRNVTRGVLINNGIIDGGKDDGQRLYQNNGE